MCESANLSRDNLSRKIGRRQVASPGQECQEGSARSLNAPLRPPLQRWMHSGTPSSRCVLVIPVVVDCRNNLDTGVTRGKRCATSRTMIQLGKETMTRTRGSKD